MISRTEVPEAHPHGANASHSRALMTCRGRVSATCAILLALSPPTLGQTTNEELKKEEIPRAVRAPNSQAKAAEKEDPELQRARSLLDQGSLDDAERTARDYVSRQRDSADGHFLLGLILFRKAKPQDSLAEYTEGAKHRAPNAFDLKIVALNYVLLLDYADADHWLTRSLQSNPRDAQAWYYLGRSKYNENRFEEAVSAFEQCLKLEPRNVKAEDNLGLAYAGLGRTDEARAAYQKAIAWQSNNLNKNSGPFTNMGSLLLEQNRAEEAVTYLLQAVQIEPGELRVHEELGKTYSRMNKLHEAQGEFEKAVAISPNKAALHFMLGQVYKKLGLSEKATAELERGAALNAAQDQTKPAAPPK